MDAVGHYNDNEMKIPWHPTRLHVGTDSNLHVFLGAVNAAPLHPNQEGQKISGDQ